MLFRPQSESLEQAIASALWSPWWQSSAMASIVLMSNMITIEQYYHQTFVSTQIGRPDDGCNNGFQIQEQQLSHLYLSSSSFPPLPCVKIHGKVFKNESFCQTIVQLSLTPLKCLPLRIWGQEKIKIQTIKHIYSLPPTIRKCPVKHLQLFPLPLKTMTPKCSSFSYIFPHVRMDWKLNVKHHIEKSTSICWKTNKGILTKNNIRVLRLIFLMNHMDLQGGVL